MVSFENHSQRCPAEAGGLLKATWFEAALPFGHFPRAHPFSKRLLPLAPLGTSGERAGERGIFQTVFFHDCFAAPPRKITPSSPRPSPPQVCGGEGDGSAHSGSGTQEIS